MTTLEEVRARFARDQGLPFADSLSELRILDALQQHGVQYRDRLFSPVTTIWGFLSQVLSEDHSCRDAVSRIIAHRAAAGLKVCSPNTASSAAPRTAPPPAAPGLKVFPPTPPSYCNARPRLPTAVLRCLAKRTAQRLQDGLPEGWKWNGRNVFIADGSHVSMPDTLANQASYPQPEVQRPGIGFPLASAESSDLLFEGFDVLAAVVGATPLLRLSRRQLPPRLGDVLLAMHPLGFDGVQPRTLDRQVAGQDPHPAAPLRPAVVRLDPRPHPLADVPGGVVPDEHQDLLPLRPQPPTHPAQEVLRHHADRPPLHDAPPSTKRASIWPVSARNGP